MIKKIIIFMLFMIFYNNLMALDYVPDDLYKWKDWAVYGEENKLCPRGVNNRNICDWYTEIILSKENNKIKFSQEIKVNQKTNVRIVGDENYIVDFVVVSSKESNKVEEMPVIYINGYPTINLNKGQYKINGYAESSRLEDKISIPQNVTSVLIMDNKDNIRLADIKNNVVFWNNIPKINKKQEEINNNEIITVYRELIDGFPLKLNTYLRIMITGEERVVDIKDLLIENFEVVNVESNLPVNISNMDISILARAGDYLIKIEKVSNESDPINIKNSNHEGLWVFQENNMIRTVSLENIKRINPNQFIKIPFNVNNKQSFYLEKNESFKIKTIQSGYQENKNENISLSRDMWLSFSGDRIYFKDKIRSENISRINYKNDNIIGNVKIDNEDSYISIKDKKEGFEVRKNKANIEVEGLYSGSIFKEMKILGIDRNVDSYSLSLHLPPGWSVFHVINGNIKNSYFSKWQLIDFFIMFLITVIVFKRWGLKSSIITILTMLLIYHNSLFNPFILLNALIAVILYNISINIIKNKYKIKAIGFYSKASLLSLIVIYIGFSFTAITETIYPDLNKNVFNINKNNVIKELYVKSDQINQRSGVVNQFDKSYNESSIKSNVDEIYLDQSKIKEISSFNENLNPQTGYGVPIIKWTTYKINWSSNISKDETFKLILITPIMQKIINLLSILGWGYIIFLLIRLKFNKIGLKNKEESNV